MFNAAWMDEALSYAIKIVIIVFGIIPPVILLHKEITSLRERFFMSERKTGKPENRRIDDEV